MRPGSVCSAAAWLGSYPVPSSPQPAGVQGVFGNRPRQPRGVLEYRPRKLPLEDRGFEEPVCVGIGLRANVEIAGPAAPRCAAWPGDREPSDARGRVRSRAFWHRRGCALGQAARWVEAVWARDRRSMRTHAPSALAPTHRRASRTKLSLAVAAPVRPRPPASPRCIRSRDRCGRPDRPPSRPRLPARRVPAKRWRAGQWPSAVRRSSCARR